MLRRLCGLVSLLCVSVWVLLEVSYFFSQCVILVPVGHYELSCSTPLCCYSCGILVSLKCVYWPKKSVKSL